MIIGFIFGLSLATTPVFSKEPTTPIDFLCAMALQTLADSDGKWIRTPPPPPDYGPTPGNHESALAAFQESIAAGRRIPGLGPPAEWPSTGLAHPTFVHRWGRYQWPELVKNLLEHLLTVEQYADRSKPPTDPRIDSWASSMGRSYSAWFLSELGWRPGINAIKTNREREESPLAQIFFDLALAQNRLGEFVELNAAELAEGLPGTETLRQEPLDLSVTSIVRDKHKLPPFQLKPLRIGFPIALSEAGGNALLAASLVLGSQKKMRPAVEARLVEILRSVLVEVDQKRLPKQRFRRIRAIDYDLLYRDVTPGSPKRLHASSDVQAYVNALVYAVGYLRIQPAFSILERYFLAAGNLIPPGGTEFPLANAPSVPIGLLAAALYSIDPSRAIDVITSKLEEFRAAFRKGPGNYDESPIFRVDPYFRFLYLDEDLTDVMLSGGIPREHKDRVKAVLVEHKTHIDWTDPPTE